MKAKKPFFISLFFLSIILIVPVERLSGDEPPVEPISLINAEKLGEDKIIISWEGLETQGIYYNIYRSSSVLDKAKELTPERLVKSLPYNQTVFTDAPPLSGNYYYAVTTTDKNKGENRVLITEQNYIITPVDIKIQAPASPATNTNQSVVPEVKAPETPTNREVTPPPVIKEESPPVTEEVIPPPPVITTPPPQKIKKTVKVAPADPATELENALKKYYFKNKYDACVKELSRIINMRSAPEKIKAKAQLFLGRTYIHLNDYDRAIRYLTQSREYFREESDFWIKEALKNIK